MREAITATTSDLRAHPVPQQIRAGAHGTTLVDSVAALLVWEPRRIVPSYAVPVRDVAADLVPATGRDGHDEHAVRVDADSGPMLDPSSGFDVHTAPGTPLDLVTASRRLPAAAFAPDDPDLDGYVVLDWAAFDSWLEEGDTVVGHPHDPFSRIDCLQSGRHVQVLVDGTVLADSRRPVMLLETWLPVRYYLPRDDVRRDLFVPSATTSVCAYKGTASYWSYEAGSTTHRDIAWSYPRPRHDAVPVSRMVAFFDERVDLVVDGVPQERPVTPWS